MARQYPESQVQPYFGKPSFVDDQRMQNSDAEFSYVRNSFFTAGQDSFTSPPAQDPEMFEKLTNIQPVVSGTLKRRWGYGGWSGSLVATPLRMSEYQRDTDGLRRIVVSSSNGHVDAFDESGNRTGGIYFPINPTADAGPIRTVTSRSYLYLADGSSFDLNKWDGNLTTSQWGIDSPIAPITNFPQTSSNDGASSGAGTGQWSSVTLCRSFDGSYTQYVNATGNPATSQYLKTGTFGFSFDTGNPTFTLTGIQVNLNGLLLVPNLDGSLPSINVQLYKAGVLQTAISHSYAGGTTSGVINSYNNGGSQYITVSFGGAADLWGTTWTASDLNNAGFGAAIKVSNANIADGITSQVFLDAVTITLYYVLAPNISSTGAGNITLVSGRAYFIAYQNSKTGSTSGLSAVSASTGPITNTQVNFANLPVSSDSQVDTKLLLATADGGDETSLYLVGAMANATTSNFDNTPEATLLVQPKYVSTDEFGNSFGIGENFRPPANAILPTKHKGRLYLAQGQTLFFSKNLAEVTTDTDTITSRWEEGWPHSNFLDISETSEAVQALLSDGSTLYIGTERRIRRLLGDGPDNFQEPEVIFNETGVLNQDVWKITFLEGQPVGTMWLTPDFRIIGSDFNSYQDVGGDVQDVLNTINTSVAKSLCFGMFASNNAFDLYFLAIPTGSNTANDTVLVYNMRAKKWCVWNNFAGGADTIVSILYSITAAGLPLILFGTSSNQIYKVGSAFTTDRGINIVSTIRTSWLDLGDNSSRKLLQEVETLSGDTAITLDVEGASLDSDFAAPRPVTIGASHIFSPFGPLKVPLATSISKDRIYRLTWHSTGTTQNVLSGFRINALPVHRF